MLGPGRLIDSQQTDQRDDGQSGLDRPSAGSGRSTGQFGGRSKSTSVYTTQVFGLATPPKNRKTHHVRDAPLGVRHTGPERDNKPARSHWDSTTRAGGHLHDDAS